MQTGFVTALQPFAITPPQVAARRTDDPGLAPAERPRDDQAERERARERAAEPGAGRPAQAGLVDGAVLVAQEAQAGDHQEDANGLTEEERRAVAELKQRDAEVRAHEAAHKASGGAHAGAVSFSYQQGPDGRRYAVGGEVPIDISTVPGDPHATALKMQQIRRAALAPADPSGADRAVAAAATKALLEAQAQITAERASAISGEAEPGATEATTPAGQSDRAEPALPGQASQDAPAIEIPGLGVPAEDDGRTDAIAPGDEPSAADHTDAFPYPTPGADRNEPAGATLSLLV